MNNNTLISVLIIAYQNVPGIYDALDSIFLQNYPEIEIVISDDGTPGFEEHIAQLNQYIKEHAGSNIKNVVINAIKVNGGTVKSINSALKCSQGKYIFTLAADDKFARKDSLDIFRNYLVQNRQMVVFSKIRGIHADGTYKYEFEAVKSNFQLLQTYTAEQIQNRLFSKNFLPGCAVFMDREVFEKYGYFPEEIRLIEDYPYWLILSRHGERFGFIDQVLIECKLEGVSSSGNYSETFMNDMQVIYDKYIFPYDKRFGICQPLYNMLKQGGLNYYKAKASWSSMTKKQRATVWLKYGIFHIYTRIQSFRNQYKNKSIIKEMKNVNH